MERLDRYKKSKDSTINYMRKVFDNSSVIDVIIARIRDVIYYISGFDIDFYTFLIFNYPRDMCDFIYSNIAPMGNIFKDEFCKVINVPAILTEIRIAIQNLMIQDSNNNNVETQQSEDDEDTNEEREEV